MGEPDASCLHGSENQVENDAMRRWTGLRLLAAIVLGVCAAGAGLSQAAASRKPARPAEERVDINRATVPELMKVPGMTATWAGRIVRFRPYRTKQDLLERGVVTSQVYDRIKDFIIAHRQPQ